MLLDGGIPLDRKVCGTRGTKDPVSAGVTTGAHLHLAGKVNYVIVNHACEGDRAIGAAWSITLE